MSLHVSWTGFWWLAELLGILAVIVIWLVPFPVHPQREEREEQLPPDAAGTMQPVPAPAGNRREAIRQ